MTSTILKMFDKVEIAACPADATNPIKAAASFVLEAKGGHGCVREFIRYLPALKSICNGWKTHFSSHAYWQFR